MRAIKDIKDAEVVLRQHDDALDNLRNKDLLLQQRQIKELGDGKDRLDAVNLGQLEKSLAEGLSGAIQFVKSIDFTGSTYVLGTIVFKAGKITEIK